MAVATMMIRMWISVMAVQIPVVEAVAAVRTDIHPLLPPSLFQSYTHTLIIHHPPKQSVKPIVIKISFSSIHGYDPTFTCGNIFQCVLGLMTQPMNHMHLTHLPIYTPTSAERADPRLYATNVRNAMADTMGVELYPRLSYVDKMQYEPSCVLREKGRVVMMV